jgi:uncharacterized protein
MRYIITGGSGLIGTALTESLANDKNEVIVLSRSPEWVVGLPPGAKAVAWDGKSATGWGHLADGAEAIINLAGENIAGEIPFGVSFTAKRKKAIAESRLKAGKAVVEAVSAAKNKPRVIVQASAMGYYGPSTGQEITEVHPAGSDFLAQVCQDWEESTSAVESMGIRRIIIRTGLVLSASGGILPWMALPFKLFIGGPIGTGKQIVSWIHLEDEIAAIRFLMDKVEAKGIYNLTAPQPLSNKEFGKAIGRTLGRPWFFPNPGFIFKLAFGEAATLFLDGQNVVPAALIKEGFEFKFPDADKCLADLLG